MKHIAILSIVALLMLFSFPGLLYAENWDGVVDAPNTYYYGIGAGTTLEEASQNALNALVENISVNVASQFHSIEEETVTNSGTASRTYARACISTYAQTSLTNVGMLHRGEEPNIEVLRYVKRSEVMELYKKRIARARNMVNSANEFYKEKKLDFALQYYYWADALIRSVQNPNEVVDNEGRVLNDWLQTRIREILRGIRVTFISHDANDEVNLRFTYGGDPVQSLGFTYNDGLSLDNDGTVVDGDGILRMAPRSKRDKYEIHIDYEYKLQGKNDHDVEPVLAVIPPRVFPEATIFVDGNKAAKSANPVSPVTPVKPTKPAPGLTTLPTATVTTCNRVLAEVMDAIRTRSYADAEDCFTTEARQMYNSLLKYGSARLAGTPQDVKLVPGTGGTVVARGIPMTFEFRQGPRGQGRKRTFREEVSFTFNSDGKICNVAFGIGHQAEQGILGQSSWNPEARELVLEFMENYKTAYHLKRYDYISSIFADDARIITGTVIRPASVSPLEGLSVSFSGQEKIRYSEQTKPQYLKNLRKCFAANTFINLRFSKNEVEWLEKMKKEKDKEYYAIQICQEYTSSTYADKGYLFLLVDMTDHDAPLIRIRTWQPDEEDLRSLYGAGNFFDK